MGENPIYGNSPIAICLRLPHATIQVKSICGMKQGEVVIRVHLKPKGHGGSNAGLLKSEL